MKKFLIILSLVIFPSLVFAQTFDHNLYFGLRNNSDVTQLQDFLTSIGLYNGPITGNFFFLTLKAVKAYQSQEGINPAAGFVGPITRAKLNQAAASAVNQSNQQAVQETGTTTPAVNQNTQAQVQQPIVVAPPSNTILCNGTYYTSCSTGSNLVCPSNGGSAYCQSPMPAQSLQPTQQNTQSPSQPVSQTPASTQTPAPITQPTIQPKIMSQARIETKIISHNIDGLGMGYLARPSMKVLSNGIGSNYLAGGEPMKQYLPMNVPGDEMNFAQVHAIVYNDDGSVTRTAEMTITATDATQNQILKGTGALIDGVYVYVFSYFFKTVGDHTITFAANGQTASVTINVPALDTRS